jgi:N-acetylglucosamine repressor
MKSRREGLFSYALSDREQKNLMILELIRKKGPITRLDISKITDINLVSISNYIKKYTDRKLVTETVSSVSSGGRKPEIVELNTKGVYVIGLDVGEKEIKGVVTDLASGVAGKARAERPAGDREKAAAAAIGLVGELCDKAKVSIDEVMAIGMGSAADEGAIRGAVEKKFGKDTFMGNAPSCAAFGEKRLNPDADVENLLYMHSDMGCGIVVRGDIYFGAGGSAGETQLSNGGFESKEEGVFLRDSTYLRPWGADLGITRLAREEIEKGVGTKMVAFAKGSIDDVSLEVVVKAALDNDEIATEILQNAAKTLGIRIAYLVNLFNPEIVVIGGGIEKAGALVMDPIRETVKKFSFKEQAGAVKVIPSALGEDVVSMGAASLAVREMFLRD